MGESHSSSALAEIEVANRLKVPFIVAENTDWGIGISKHTESAIAKAGVASESMMSFFPSWESAGTGRPAPFRAGGQQMLAIGRALMSRPRLLLVDELSLGLAPMITQSIYRTLSALGADITILLVEQNVEQALNFSQRATSSKAAASPVPAGPPTCSRMPTSAGRAWGCSVNFRAPLQSSSHRLPRSRFLQPSKIFHLSKPLFAYRIKFVE